MDMVEGIPISLVVGVEVEAVAVVITRVVLCHNIMATHQINDPGTKTKHNKRRKAIMNGIIMNGIQHHMGGGDEVAVEAGDGVEVEVEERVEMKYMNLHKLQQRRVLHHWWLPNLVQNYHMEEEDISSEGVAVVDVVVDVAGEDFKVERMLRRYWRQRRGQGQRIVIQVRRELRQRLLVQNKLLKKVERAECQFQSQYKTVIQKWLIRISK